MHDDARSGARDDGRVIAESDDLVSPVTASIS
jgi:hypothetical protein